MVWIFALGVIWLAIVHEGFRRLIAWLLTIGAATFVLLLIHLAFS